MHRRTKAETLLEAVERAGRRPPLEIWEDLIRKGFIDREGRVTRLIGGVAEPEPEALRRRHHGHTRSAAPRPARRARPR